MRGSQKPASKLHAREAQPVLTPDQTDGVRDPGAHPPRVLIVCDVPTAAEIVQVTAALADLAEVTVAPDAEAIALLRQLDPDVIIAEDHLAARGGRDLLAEAATIQPIAVPILLAEPQARVDTTDSDEPAVLPKPVDSEALRTLCALALRSASWHRRARALEIENRCQRLVDPEAIRSDLDEVATYEGILTHSPPMLAVLAMLRAIEESDVTVLIHGETGTGKELVGRAIHARSRRRRGPFVAVNLGAISDQLRESELFGHVRGAFTGAIENRGGLFAEANGGCIFLDEVGDASPSLQVALLRVLEESTITPVGADRPRRLDVRVIAATNRRLEELVRRRRFRSDLYYRLNVFPVELPPLRERSEDVFPLAHHFLGVAARQLGRDSEGISRDARVALEKHNWPGNVRELRNVMERALLLRKGGLVVAADLPIASAAPTTPATQPAIDIPREGATLHELEREIFRKTLALTDGNKTRAARMLGLHEATFRFRLRKLESVPGRELP